MFTVNDDMSIYATRGDVVFFSVSAYEGEVPYTFKVGDVVRITVTDKKDCEAVCLQKDFTIEAETQTVAITLSEDDTRFGEVISKPTDYWYEIELNPHNAPQTIIGYDEDGAKIFKLFPEGDDIEYVPSEEVVKEIDDELDVASERPVQNQAIARAMYGLIELVEMVQTENEHLTETISDNIREIVDERLEEEIFSATGVTKTTSTTLDNSIEGRVKINTIGGVSRQDDAPTPSHPVDIRNAFECPEMIQGTYKYADGTFANSTTQICNKNPIPCKEGDKIVIEAKSGNIPVIVYYKDGAYLSYGSGSTNVITKTVPSGATHFNFYVSNNNGITPSTAGKIKVTINGKVVVSIRTVDENGNKSEAVILLSCSLKNGDAIYKENGVWKHKMARYGEKVKSDCIHSFVSSEYGNYVSVSTDWDALISETEYVAFSDRFIPTTFADSTSAYLDMARIYVDNNGAVVIRDNQANSYLSSLESFQSFVDSNEIYIEYRLATPIIEELPLEDQIALNSLKTFNGTTTLVFDSYVKPTSEAEYGESPAGAYAIKGMLVADEIVMKSGVEVIYNSDTITVQKVGKRVTIELFGANNYDFINVWRDTVVPLYPPTKDIYRTVIIHNSDSAMAGRVWLRPNGMMSVAKLDAINSSMNPTETSLDGEISYNTI